MEHNPPQTEFQPNALSRNPQPTSFIYSGVAAVAQCGTLRCCGLRRAARRAAAHNFCISRPAVRRHHAALCGDFHAIAPSAVACLASSAVSRMPRVSDGTAVADLTFGFGIRPFLPWENAFIWPIRSQERRPGVGVSLQPSRRCSGAERCAGRHRGGVL